MRKTIPFWAVATAAICLVCGSFVCPVPAAAGQSRSTALPAVADSVQNGTHFLVRLDREMSTGKTGHKVEVKLEPLDFSGCTPPARIGNQPDRAGRVDRTRSPVADL